MNIENITLTGNNKSEALAIPFVEMMTLQSSYILVVKNILEGTDSSVWLDEGNVNALKKLKNDRGTS